MRIRRIASKGLDILLALIFVYLLISPRLAASSTKSALVFCANSLLPALFVYTVLSLCLISSPLIGYLSKRLGNGVIVYLLGLLCGYPIGTRLALSLYKSGRIDKKHAEYLTSFTNNASLSFVVGFVGGELLKSVRLGLLLFAYQAISSLICAGLMRLYLYRGEKIPKQDAIFTKKASPTEILFETAQNMLNICACVTFYIVIGDALCEILDTNALNGAILKSLLEFSSGAYSASFSPYPFHICALAISFGGLSVLSQVKSLASGSLSIKPYLWGKLICSCLMMLLCFVG